MLIHENNVISIKVRFLMPQTYGFSVEDVKTKNFNVNDVKSMEITLDELNFLILTPLMLNLWI